ncbi:MAG: DUF6150 family protein [Bacteroidota bacterium]
MSVCWLLLLLAVFSGTVSAQSRNDRDPCELQGAVFIEEVESFADYRVFRENVEGFADLLVFREQARTFADRPGLWYFTDNRAMADFTIAFTETQGFDDFSVFFTDFKSIAGCRP